MECSNQIGLENEAATDRMKWRNSVHELSRKVRRIQPPPLTNTKHLISESFSLGGKTKCS